MTAGDRALTGGLIGPVGESQKPRGGIGRCDTQVIVGAASAVQLDSPVDDLASHVGHGHLDHRDLGLCHLVAHGVHAMRRVQRQQPRLFDQDARLGDAFYRDALLGNGLSEGDAREAALAHQFQHTFGQSDEPHAMRGCALGRAVPAQSRSHVLRPAVCWRPARTHW